MDDRTALALETSILHWEENLDFAQKGDYDSVNIWSDNCALCLLTRTCIGCPVAERVGNIDCRDTPWRNVNTILRRIKENKSGLLNPTAPLVEAIQEEIDFLKSLREPTNA